MVVKDFYELLGDIKAQYKMKENTYNMDEKGIQLGVGGCVFALVDQDQKNVHQVKDRN